MDNLITISTEQGIAPEYRQTPISRLVEYHNIGRPFDHYTSAELLIGMCMDHRKRLRIPENFAYIIRTGGANLRYSEFQVSYALSIGNIKHIALIGHTDCGMVNLAARKEKFVQGLKENFGWEQKRAEEHFMHLAPLYEIDNEVAFIAGEAKRLRKKYPNLTVAPLLYKVEDNRLYLIKE